MVRIKKGRKPQGVELEQVSIPESNPEADAHSVRERAVLVRLVIRWWAPTVKDVVIRDEVEQKHGVKKGSVTVTKRRMAREVFAGIGKPANEARAYNKEKAWPWGDTGARILPIGSFFDYRKKMIVWKNEFEREADKFVAHYSEHALAQKKLLGGAWRAEDYPPAEIVRAQFYFSAFVEPVADDFRVALSKADKDEVEQAYAKLIGERLKGTVTEVFTTTAALVEEVRDKLANADATIKSGTFGALKRLAASLPALNSVVQDPAIKALSDTIAQSLLDVDIDSIAHDPTVRKTARNKADAILAALKPLQSRWGVTQGV